MNTTLRTLLTLTLLLTGTIAQAGNMYVTDRIVLDMYEEDSTISPVIKQVPTGTPMTVLEVNGPYAKVRLKDGTTGWVENGFLTDEKPIQNLYTELMGKYKKLQKQLEAGGGEQPDLEELKAAARDAGWMKVEMNKARDETKSLKGQLELRDKKVARLEAEVQSLKSVAARKTPDVVSVANVSNETDEAALALETIKVIELPANAEGGSSSGIPLAWFIGVMPVLFILGVIGGIYYLDNKIRKRHGGMRLY